MGIVLLLWRLFGLHREQPGQPHHGRAHPGPLGGYRLLLEWVFLRLALN